MSRWLHREREYPARAGARLLLRQEGRESPHAPGDSWFQKTPMRGAKAKYNNNPIEKCPSQPSLRGCRRTRAAIPGKGCHRLARVITDAAPVKSKHPEGRSPDEFAKKDICSLLTFRSALSLPFLVAGDSDFQLLNTLWQGGDRRVGGVALHFCRMARLLDLPRP
jgi:hypothetical protein